MGTYRLDEVMFHEIPRGRPGDSSDELTATTSLTDIDAHTHDFICDDMLEQAVASARTIVEDPSAGSEFCDLVREVMANSDHLPSHSRDMAERLFGAQAPGSPKGVFMAALGTQRGAKRLILMKAEHQQGVRLDMATDGSTFNVEHIRDLIVGNNAKVYKTAVLQVDPNSQQVSGILVDHQAMGYAAFFLEKFLQCRLARPDETLTRDFVKTIEKFAHQAELGIDEKTTFMLSAAMYLERPNEVINPTSFISDHVPVEHRDLFESLLPIELKNNIEFKQDSGLVKSQLGGIRLNFGIDVTLISSTAAFEDGLIDISRDGNRTVITINEQDGSQGNVKLSRPKR